MLPGFGSSTLAHCCASVDEVRTRPGWGAGTGGLDVTPKQAIPIWLVAKRLAGLEGRHGVDGYCNDFAGAGIATPAWRAVAGGELAEPRDVDGPAFFKRVGDGRDDGIERGGRIGPGQRRAAGDACTKLRAIHGFTPVHVRVSMFEDARGLVDPGSSGRTAEGGHARDRGSRCDGVTHRRNSNTRVMWLRAARTKLFVATEKCG